MKRFNEINKEMLTDIMPHLITKGLIASKSEPDPGGAQIVLTFFHSYARLNISLT